jgi:PD-(D/E)XK nuclease superfamily
VRYLRVTEILDLAGVTDHQFCTDEGKWKGSEVHRATELLDRGRLRSFPDTIGGHLYAYKKFKTECGFVPEKVEVSCVNKLYRVRGRADRVGFLVGRRCVLDLKNGAIQPAVDLQLALYGEAIDPDVWWDRIAVQLLADGTYRARRIDRMSYRADLATAHAAIRLAHWKREKGIGRKGES